MNKNVFENIEKLASNNPEIDGLLPLIEINLPVSNDALGLAESNIRVRGIDGEYSDNFDTLKVFPSEPNIFFPL